MVSVNLLFDHTYVFAPDAVNVTVLPIHTDTGFGEMITVGFGKMVTMMASVAVKPLRSFAVTVYVMVTDGVAVGLLTVVLLKPVAGAHLYVYGAVPPPAAACK